MYLLLPFRNWSDGHLVMKKNASFSFSVKFLCCRSPSAVGVNSTTTAEVEITTSSTLVDIEDRIPMY